MASNASMVVTNFQKQFGIESGLIFRGIILEILARIIERTPVDTGRLAGNWQAGVNVSPGDIIEGANEDQALSTATALIASATPSETVILINNLPYARVAEEGLWGTAHAGDDASKVTTSGFSKKAKSGMVAVTVAEFDEIVKAVVGKLS